MANVNTSLSTCLITKQFTKMADRRYRVNLTHSQINACDEFFDLCCTPCSKKKRNRSALKYCVTCKEYFCVTCVESHNSFQALSRHLLVNPQTSKLSSRTGRKKLHAFPTELCTHHPMEVVNMYCGKEDIVGCSVCFTFNHKSCDDIHYIPEYIQSHFPAEHANQINNDLTEAIKAMKKLKTQQDNLDDDLDKSKATCKQEIQKYRQEINNKIDNIEAATLAELDARHKDMQTKTYDTNPNIHVLYNELIRFKSEIESVQSNDAQKFVITKLSQWTIKQGRELQSKLSNDQTPELTFTRNADIMTFLLRIVTLGLLGHQEQEDSLQTVTTSSKQPQSTQCTSSSASTDTTCVLTIQDTGNKLLKKTLSQGLYKITDTSEYNIKQPDDKFVCDIMSSCILDNGNILLADYKNKKLKLVDCRTYTVRTALALDDRPWSVCRVSSTETVVCLRKTIQFVSTSGDTLEPMRSLSLKHHGKCIFVIKDRMYVGGGHSVYIYTLNGELVQTISTNISQNIWDITVSDDEKMIHVVVCMVGVITLNTDGNVVWRYSGTELSAACGVCTDGNGTVVVSGYDSNNVIQLGPDGKYIGQIISSSDGVKSPQTVCYDRNTHKLIIGNNGKTITVFTLQSQTS